MKSKDIHGSLLANEQKILPKINSIGFVFFLHGVPPGLFFPMLKTGF